MNSLVNSVQIAVLWNGERGFSTSTFGTAGIALIATSMLVTSTPVSAQESSLYDALGQESGISRIVDETVVQILNDARIKTGFKETNMKRLAQLLKEQFCVVAGGPCKYSGDDMALVHAFN